MIKHFCDRCGKEAVYRKQPKDVQTIETAGVTLYTHESHRSWIELELCEDCEQFFLENMKSETAKTSDKDFMERHGMK